MSTSQTSAQMHASIAKLSKDKEDLMELATLRAQVIQVSL